MSVEVLEAGRTIRQTKVTMENGDVWLVDTNNLDVAFGSDPIGGLFGAIAAMVGGSDDPFETMIAGPDGVWLNYSKSNYATEDDALACHDRFVALIAAGKGDECEGNDTAIIEQMDECEATDA